MKVVSAQKKKNVPTRNYSIERKTKLEENIAGKKNCSIKTTK